MNKENIIDYVLQTPHNPNKKVLDDMLETLIEESGGTNNLTYSWNDLTDKPFYEEIGEVFICEEEEAYIGGTFNWSVDGEPLVIGQEYTVAINGQEYTSIVKEDANGVICCGNTTLFSGEDFSPSGEDTGEPFVFANRSNSDKIFECFFAETLPDSITFAISTVKEIVKCLDEKFIPDTIARTDHTHSWNDLTDKPFGEIEDVLWEGDWSILSNLESAKIGNTDVIKIFDEPMSEDELIGYTCGLYDSGRECIDFEEEIEGFRAENGYLANFGWRYIFIVKEDTTIDGVNISKGVWIRATEEYYLRKIYKTNIKTIDFEYLPESLRFYDDTRAVECITDGEYQFGDASYYYDRTCCRIENGWFNLEEGAKYSVIFNGEEYTGEIVYFNGHYCIGNASILSDSYENTGEPFAIVYYISYECFEVHLVDDIVDETHNISLFVAEGGIIQLDEKYIPNTIARVSDISESFSGSWNDLKDKPFGEIVDNGILCEDMSWNGIVKYNISVGKWKKCDELIPNIVSVVNKLNGIENTIVGYGNKPGYLAISEDNRVVYGYEENTLRYLIILEDNVTTTVDTVELTFTQSGFYVNIGVEGTYPVTYSYTQFKTIDENVIPDTIVRQSALEAYETEIVDKVLSALPTWDGGSY